MHDDDCTYDYHDLLRTTFSDGYSRTEAELVGPGRHTPKFLRRDLIFPYLKIWATVAWGPILKSS